MDLRGVQKTRAALIRARVVTPDDPQEEIDERASYLLSAMHTFARAMRPALNAEDLSTGEVFRRLAAVADADAEATKLKPKGSPR